MVLIFISTFALFRGGANRPEHNTYSELLKALVLDHQYLSHSTFHEFIESMDEQTMAYFMVVVRPKWFETLAANTPQHVASSTSVVEVAGRGKKQGGPAQVFNLQTNRETEFLKLFGQDAVGVSKDNRLLIVADGVGGAPLSEHTANIIVKMVLLMYEADPSRFDLIKQSEQILRVLFKFVNDIPLIPGSTTLVIAQHCQSTVKVWSYGDSRAMLFGADGTLKMQSVDGEFERNFPFQIGHEVMFSKMKLDGIFTSELEYASGDRLMVMSDGVSDNLWEPQIKAGKSAQEIADLALQVAWDKTANVPFYNSTMPGGKPDDISIVFVTLQ